MIICAPLAAKAPIEQMELKGVDLNVRKVEHGAKMPLPERSKWNRAIGARQAKIRDASLAPAV